MASAISGATAKRDTRAIMSKVANPWRQPALFGDGSPSAGSGRGPLETAISGAISTISPTSPELLCPKFKKVALRGAALVVGVRRLSAAAGDP